MQTHKMHVVIPKDHRLVVDVPQDIRSGPAELILVVPTSVDEVQRPPGRDALDRWDAAVTRLGADPRPFHSLSREEKQERQRMIRGIGKGILPSSEEFVRAKRDEVELEERKFGH